MEINCLSCGHKIDVGDAYDDFEGEVKCFACGGVLCIKAEQGQLKSVKVARARETVPPPEGETEDQPVAR